ncbi:MAG: hypothetical protein GTO63_36740 [Anaerolineae bacterium]|nr:hypothetical protein [Anaerolineae bacterium]NIO00302.1 hypothetical protein [Anaerolineae bacterium]NIQ83080.1 hypothetical protein [Anaerolineae bacterium]
MVKSKVVVVGLDGMTPQLVEPWMKEGKLPNLARMAQEGAYGRLLSTLPPASPQAWSSFLTGKNPGKHGVFGFTHRKQDSQTWTLTTAKDRVGPDLGHLISSWGSGAGLLLVPLTYPPQPVNGFVVSGMGTPGSRAEFTYPQELKGELLREFGEEALFEPPIVDQEPLEYYAELERFIERNQAVFDWLRNRFCDLDYHMVVFVSPDRIQHVAWHYMESAASRVVSPQLRSAILRLYKKVDDVVGGILSTLDSKATLIVMSDHGAGPYRKFVDLNNWLAQQGFLTFAQRSEDRSEQVFTKAYRLWRSGPRKLLSPWQRRRLKQRLPRYLAARITAEWKGTHVRQVDWSRTQAYSEGTGGLIALNLHGVQPQGIVQPEEREDMLRRIETELYGLRDPETNDSVVERVWRREEVYSGEAIKRAPDLIVGWSQEGYHSRVMWNPHGPVFHDPGKWRTTRLTHSCRHRREGVIFATGPFVAPGTCVQGAEIVDLAPTVLALMGLPLLPDFDGKVLEELTVGIEKPRVEVAAESDLHADHSIVYSEDEAEEVEDLLRGLGYIE